MPGVRLRTAEREAQRRLRRWLEANTGVLRLGNVRLTEVEASGHSIGVAAIVDGNSVDVSFEIACHGMVNYQDWWCASCDDTTCGYAYEPCNHCRRAVMEFAFWESGDDVDDWLDTHLDAVEKKPSSGHNYKWPYIEFFTNDSGLLVCARRVEEVLEDGEIRRINRGRAIAPGKLLAEVKLKPSGPQREALQHVADALVDLRDITDDGDDYLRVPDSMVAFTLFAAVEYPNSIILLEEKFAFLSLLPAIDARFEWQIDEAQCQVKLDGIENGQTFWRSIPPVHLTKTGQIARVRVADGKSINEMVMLDAMPKIPVDDMDDAYGRIIDRYPAFPLPHPTSDDALVDIDAKRLTFVLRFPKEHGYAAQLLFRYYRGVELDDHGPYTSISKKHGKTYRIARDVTQEEQAMRLLSSKGLEQFVDENGLIFGSRAQTSVGDDGGVQTDPAFWADFFEQSAPRLIEQGWRIFPPKSPTEIIDCDALDAQFGDGDGEGTFRLSMAVDVDGEKIAILPLVLDLLQRYGYESMDQAFSDRAEFSHLAVNERRVLRMPTERLRAIVNMVQDSIKVMTVDGDSINLPFNRAAEIGLLDSRWGDGIRWTGDGRMKSLLEVFNGFRDPDLIVIPDNIRSKLETYQHEGVSRADFLANNELSMLLCDDMGLGKTLQMLTRYAAAKERDPSIGPALVLAPTTALLQWEDEVEKHCHGLTVAQTGMLNGKDIGKTERPAYYRRCKDGQLDILVSTYKKAHLDIDYIREVPWYMVVADEAQAIKNPGGQFRKSVRSIPASFKYPVTGTPIENNLMELWALFDVALPGYLGGEKWFKTAFADPIELEQDGDALKRLKALIAPVLRRKRATDDDVDTEIPEPVLKVIEVPISGLQRDLYESVRVVQESQVKELLKKQGLKQATGQVLMAISGMRQIVCDPRTYTRQDHDVIESAKLDRLGSLIESFKSDGKQALVFSNFKRMMPLFSSKADVLEVPHGVVSGDVSQKNRKREIAAFRNGDTQVLFATLGAMNSSIDLYEAKATVLYEPWWNPQKENQGIGRMVRRGQKHHTTVYRLISPNTVEMQLMRIQDRKLALVDAVFNEDIVALTRCLTESDVAELFR